MLQIAKSRKRSWHFYLVTCVESLGNATDFLETHQMTITNEDLEEFRKAWQEDFNEELTVEQARTETIRILELYRILYESASEGSQEEEIQQT